MPVVHNKVIQLPVGNVVKRTVFARKHHAVVSTHLLKQLPPLLLDVPFGEAQTNVLFIKIYVTSISGLLVSGRIHLVYSLISNS